MDQEFEQLMTACAEIAEDFPAGLAFIGGIGVYLHCRNLKETESLAETTHDADFYISMVDMSDLRDLEEVTPNRRLSRHQLIKRGFEFDIYTERQSNLRIPYDEVMAHSQSYDIFRVACPEHLLVLKLIAYKDRKGSVKGEKDARDLVCIASVLSASPGPIRVELMAPYLADDELSLLEGIVKSPVLVAMANGNVHVAKQLRGSFSSVVDLLRPSSPRPLPKP